MSQQEVLVAGGGPVGFLTALGLARRGIPVTLLEAEESIVDSPRAVVYHWSVLEGLEALGILEDAKAAGFTKQDYCYMVFRGREVIAWTLEPLVDRVRHPYNLHLGQHKLTEIARAHLQRLPNAAVHFASRVTGVTQDTEGVTVRAQTPDGVREFRGHWLVGADGGRSAVRDCVGLPLEGMTWPERFVATNVRYDFEQHGYRRSTLLVDPNYGAVIVKIDDSGLWRCTYAEDAALPEDTVLDRLPRYFEVLLSGASDLELVQYAPYRMHQRSAPTYRAGRVLLAGDAAHITNPVGGLGLTMGLFDSFALVDALSATIGGEAGGGSGEDILDRYSAERRRIFLEVTSPQATENKRFIYHSADPVRLEQDLAVARRLTYDKQFLLDRLLFTRRMQTHLLPRHSAASRRSDQV